MNGGQTEPQLLSSRSKRGLSCVFVGAKSGLGYLAVLCCNGDVCDLDDMYS